LTPNAGHSI